MAKFIRFKLLIPSSKKIALKCQLNTGTTTPDDYACMAHLSEVDLKMSSQNLLINVSRERNFSS